MEETTASMDRTLGKEFEASLVDGYLPCPAAFKIAKKLDVSRQQVGEMANKLKVRISNCQLGFFKFEKATHDDLKDKQIDRTLTEEIEAVLVDGHLPCPVAFRIAKKMKVAPKEVGDAATKLNARTTNCQLGCFP